MAQVITPGLRGFGGSDKPAGPFGPQEQARDVLAMLETNLRPDANPISGDVSERLGSTTLSGPTQEELGRSVAC